MKLFTTLLVPGIIAICLGLAVLLAVIILKIVAKKKADADPTPTPVDTDAGDNKSAADTTEKGEGTTSDEKVATADEKPCSEKGALAAAKNAEEKADAADKKATEAVQAAKTADEKAEAADKKATEADEKAEKALEANQATDKKVEEEKARVAEEKRKEFMAKHANEIGLYVLQFSEAYKAYANAIHQGNVRRHDANALAVAAEEANQERVTLESTRICQKAKYAYAGELKQNGYEDIDYRQRNQEEVAPEELEKLDAEEQNAFCTVAEANANLDAAKAAAETAVKALENNKAEENGFGEATESAVAEMKAAYEKLVACKLNDDEIAAKVNLSVDMLKVIVA